MDRLNDTLRAASPWEVNHGVIQPCFCVIAQGSKMFLLGDSRYRYDPSRYLIVTIELPSIRQVLEAAPERPCLGLRMDLGPALVEAVIEEASQGSRPESGVVGSNNTRGGCSPVGWKMIFNLLSCQHSRDGG